MVFPAALYQLSVGAWICLAVGIAIHAVTLANLLFRIQLSGLIFARWIYNLYFHPLAPYPGPMLARISWLYYAIYTYKGALADNTKRLHGKYGAVVRIAPNIISFDDAQAWEDIYGEYSNRL